jgi:DNA adenine methylase
VGTCAVVSPLRYPGGKKKVLPLIQPFWAVPHDEYREPFCGGGNVFLAKAKAAANWINDADKGVADLWRALADPETNTGLCDLVRGVTPPTVEDWRTWRDLKPASVLESAFRTLFLNRTSYSGIQDAGPIGGLNQTGSWKVGARWNPRGLSAQIQACLPKLMDVRITAIDFEDLVDAPGRNVFLYLDPPYYHKGNQLYQVKMTTEDHQRLANLLKRTPHPFLLTYDDCPEVRELYAGTHMYERSWFYSGAEVSSRRQGKELFVSNFPVVIKDQATFF